ncbi:MAG TPA: acyl-CoA synthetase, partial [Pseudomonas pachastrellae]|nr:acyl-CoA synthetase [Halopseudomonas pachastrellae]
THSAPLNVFLLGGTYVGAAHVVLPEFHPKLLLDTVEQQRTTHFFGAPVAFMMTAQQPDIAERDISSMQYWIYGGGPMSTEQLEILADRMQTDRLYCVYGLTEAGPSGSIMMPAEHASKAGSIGCRGALHTELRLVDEQGNEVSGEGTGQIQIRTEGMMLGYWNKPDATAECLHSDGWLDSGDLARRDAAGYYWVLGRAKELIISGGVNVYPREIEVALEAHPNVVEVAVFGVPHPQWGETVKAVVVVREPVADLHAELSAYLEPLLADYKRPRLYAEMDMLPRNANGKVMKHQLS